MSSTLSFVHAVRSINRLLRLTTQTPRAELVDLRRARGRVLAADLLATANVPAFDNAAMDGYALRGCDLPSSSHRQFALLGSQLAGQSTGLIVGEGQCVRVTTGSQIPGGADTVVMQENVERIGNLVRISASERAGSHVRPVGGDLQAGRRVLRQGTRLEAAQLGVIASLGMPQIGVFERIGVAHFSTGDELCALGRPLPIGGVYDSNSVTLSALLEADGLLDIPLAPIADQRHQVKEALLKATQLAPIVLTTGGASVGEADYLLAVLSEIGNVEFAKVLMRPGLPFIAAKVGHALVFALPGNPVSVMACYRMLLSAALKRAGGSRRVAPLRLRAELDSRIDKSHSRREFVRAVLSRDLSGNLRVRSTGSQSSQLLSSMSAANALIILNEQDRSIEAGCKVCVEML